MRTSIDQAEFWRDIETRYGVVLDRTLLRHNDGPGAPPGLWGVSFVTSTELHFWHFPGGNWFASLVQRPAERAEKEVRWAVALTDITAITPPPRRNPVHRLLLGADGNFSVDLLSGGTLRLELVDGATTFVASLMTAWEAARKI